MPGSDFLQKFRVPDVEVSEVPEALELGQDLYDFIHSLLPHFRPPEDHQRLELEQMPCPRLYVLQTQILDVIGLDRQQIGRCPHEEVEHVLWEVVICDLQGLELLQVTSAGSVAQFCHSDRWPGILLLNDQGHEVGTELDDLREVHVLALDLESLQLVPDRLDAVVDIVELQQKRGKNKS